MNSPSVACLDPRENLGTPWAGLALGRTGKGWIVTLRETGKLVPWGVGHEWSDQLTKRDTRVEALGERMRLPADQGEGLRSCAHGAWGSQPQGET